MRTGWVLVGALLSAVMVSTAAFSTVALAQDKSSTKPPMVGDKPLLQVKPKATPTAAKPKSTGKPQSTAVKLQACLELDDGTKDRLNCYDTIFPPKPNPKAAAAKGVADCRFKKEEDDRLACFNDFAERIPKLPKS